MKKIERIFKDREFWFFVIITALFFGALSKLDFATDTYEVFEKSGKEMLMHFISSGRFITGIAYAIIKVLKISHNVSYMVSFAIAIFSIAISIYKLNEVFNKDIESKALSKILSVLIIINVFSIELFFYIEKGIMCLSVLFCVLALERLIGYFETKNKKELIITFIYMMLANSSYQGTVALFIALALIYILKYSKSFKAFIINNIITSLCYGIPAGINLVIVKIFANNRIVGEHNLKNSLIKIMDGIDNMLKTYSIISGYIFKIMIILVVIILIYYIIKNKDENKKKILSILSILYITFGILFITVLPQFMQATESIWFVPRSSYAFGAIFAILFSYLLINYKIDIKLKYVMIALFIIYLLVQYSSFQTIIRDHYIMNYMDEVFANKVKQHIEQYEKNTGETVNKVAFYQGKEIHWSYSNLKAIGDMNIRGMAPEWSRISFLKYYLDREFEEVTFSEDIKDVFLKNIRNDYTSDQIYLEDSVLNIFIY